MLLRKVTDKGLLKSAASWERFLQQSLPPAPPVATELSPFFDLPWAVHIFVGLQHLLAVCVGATGLPGLRQPKSWILGLLGLKLTWFHFFFLQEAWKTYDYKMGHKNEDLGWETVRELTKQPVSHNLKRAWVFHHSCNAAFLQLWFPLGMMIVL